LGRARRKQSAKRGGALQRVPLDQGATLVAPEGTPGEDLLALDEALQQLDAEDPVKAQLVKLRFFGGVSLEDAAAMLGVSPATAKRYWVFARSWLYGKLRGD
jgi:RNA polymerase sigma factor (TIGR02999 family)